MTFNKVDFIFALRFLDKTIQLRSLSGLECVEQGLLKIKCTKEKCSLQKEEMHSKEIAQSMIKRNAIFRVAVGSYLTETVEG